MSLSASDLHPVLRDPDVRLMLRVKQGDEGAFTQLVSRYQDRLVGVLSHLLQDLESAEDVAQEVFLRIYRSRQSYQPAAKFSTWMFHIANNLASNARRDQGRKREVSLQRKPQNSSAMLPSEQFLKEKSALMPTRQADKTELRAVVQAALTTLSERQRMAVLLHKFEEMSYADIGAALDLSPQAVKSLLSRARDNLRDMLEPYLKQGRLDDELEL